MQSLRKSEERGKGEYGWLSARYTFSFSSYFDEKHTGFRDLLVINEDRIDPAKGFAEHPHRDMEIITYIIDGAIEHKDSMGNVGIIRAGEVQRMSAGTGVRHSEYNPNADEGTHLLQIWIQPEETGIEPGYEQMSYVDRHKNSNLVLLASPDARDNSMKIHQDVLLYSGRLKSQEELSFAIPDGRHAWVQLVKGELSVDGQMLNSGDGLAISEVKDLEVKASSDADFLLFDLK